ncbi:MAG: antitoxin VapB40 [Nitrospirales bacterium]|nr:MAG: antitoxin VapB40 [Nitrospirales bacterium]
MKTTIDLSGRLVIPKEIRKVAGLEPGIPLEVRWREGVVEIEPAPLPVKLIKRGRLLVAVPEKTIDSLSNETVKRARQQVRRGPSSSS